MTPGDRGRLLAARELVVVDLTDAALVALLAALELEHPTLEHPPFSGGPPTLRRARSVIRLAQRLRNTLEHYRCAVDAALVFASKDDDIPF
jgi:hypothetical protein